MRTQINNIFYEPINIFLLQLLFLFTLGNFICDIMRAATQSDVALLNSGSFRSDVIHPVGPFKMKVNLNVFIKSYVTC